MPPSVRPSPGAIFLSFLRLGATAFGGPAMIPYIREMAVTRKQWLSPSQFSLGMALAQAIPGATAMQAAAYTGLRAGGVGGALAAYIGFGLPAFGLIAVLSALYATFRDTSFILAAMSGLQVIVVALVGNASIDFANRHLDTRLDKILALAAGCVFGLKGSPVLAIAGVCLAGVLLYSDEPYEPAPVIAGNVSWKPVAALGVLLGVCLIVMRFLAPGLFQLGATMLKVDLFAFGGGYVALPIMLHEVVDVHAWMSRPVFMDGIALGQVTPGPIVMTAGFVGYLVMGFSGAAWATICVFAPSFFMVCGLTPVAERLLSNAFFRRAVRASLASLVGLMAAVTGTFMLSAHWQPASIGLAVGAFVALRRGVDILWVVIAGAAVAMLVLQAWEFCRGGAPTPRQGHHGPGPAFRVAHIAPKPNELRSLVLARCAPHKGPFEEAWSRVFGSPHFLKVKAPWSKRPRGFYLQKSQAQEAVASWWGARGATPPGILSLAFIFYTSRWSGSGGPGCG